MNDDTLTRVRATLARLAEVEREATPGPWKTDRAKTGGGMRIYGPRNGKRQAGACVVGGCGCCDSPFGDNAPADRAAIVALRNAAPALLALADAATILLVVRGLYDPWWTRWQGKGEPFVCEGCKAEYVRDGTDHADGCPAVAIDRALAALAALADAPGKVQP